YNRALSAAEIQTDMNTPVGGTPADTTPPTITAIAPASGASGVPLTAPVTATFSEDVQPASVSTGTFELRDPNNALVPAAVSYDPATRTATLTASAGLGAATTYTARVKGGSAGVKDLAGNALAADKVWSFTTSAGGGFQETVAFSGLSSP